MEKLKKLWKSLGRTEYLRCLGAFIKWLLIGTLVGMLVGCVGSLFAHTLIFANGLRTQFPYIIFTLPVGGLLIVFLYRVCKNSGDKGTNTILSSIQEGTQIPFRMAPLIFVSTTITQLCGGSAGREGAALQLGGSISKNLGKLLRLNSEEQKTMVMCGMSAGFSALFGTPLAAAVFSMEVASVGIMQYSALVPCVTASLTAHFMAKLFKVPPEVFPVSGLPAATAVSLLKIAAFALVVAGVSIVFCLLLHKAEHLYAKYIKNPYLRIAAAGCVLILLTLLLGTDAYLGSGMGIVEHIFHKGETDRYGFLFKMLFTAVTLGAGFKGGEIVPSFTIGAALGCAVASPLGLPVGLVAACGMVGLFCGVTNSPMTSLLIAFELFGFEGMPYYLVAVAVCYLLSGSRSLYHKQRIVCSKIGTGTHE